MLLRLAHHIGNTIRPIQERIFGVQMEVDVRVWHEEKATLRGGCDKARSSAPGVKFARWKKSLTLRRTLPYVPRTFIKSD